MGGNVLDRRALVLRVGYLADQMGHESVALSDDISVMYNVGDAAPKLYDVCLEHAAQNQGRLLLPISSRINVRNLYLCGTFIMLFSDKRYVQGRIVDSGAPYIYGIGDFQYSTPPIMRVMRARHWVKLEEVTGGEKFDSTGWYVDKFIDGRQLTLDEAIARSKRAATIALKD